MFESISKDILSLEDKDRADHSQRFFKTGKGEYGEGDVFLGLSVPLQRSIAKQYYATASYNDVIRLLSSQYHEFRLVGVIILVRKYQSAKDISVRREIVDVYLNNTDRINNWDIVDASAHKILGEYCIEIENNDILVHLSKSSNMWEQRMSIIATHAHVSRGKTQLIYRLSKSFLSHPHDLMHKATGWLLREAGKKDRKGLNHFLDQFAEIMPRTMLRYALEKHSQEDRRYYMNLK
jgi:3-methyladenine DNA glycosylase AlkD